MHNNRFITLVVLLFTAILISLALVQDFGSNKSYGLIIIILVFIGWILKQQNFIK